MQSQLEKGLKKLSLKLKKEVAKRKTSNNWSRVFQIALKGGEGLKILLEQILTI